MPKTPLNCILKEKETLSLNCVTKLCCQLYNTTYHNELVSGHMSQEAKICETLCTNARNAEEAFDCPIRGTKMSLML